MLAISENARLTNALGDALLCAMHWCFVYRFLRRGRVTGDRARALQGLTLAYYLCIFPSLVTLQKDFVPVAKRICMRTS